MYTIKQIVFLTFKKVRLGRVSLSSFKFRFWEQWKYRKRNCKTAWRWQWCEQTSTLEYNFRYYAGLKPL